MHLFFFATHSPPFLFCDVILCSPLICQSSNQAVADHCFHHHLDPIDQEAYIMDD